MERQTGPPLSKPPKTLPAAQASTELHMSLTEVMDLSTESFGSSSFLASWLLPVILLSIAGTSGEGSRLEIPQLRGSWTNPHKFLTPPLFAYSDEEEIKMPEPR